MLSHSAPAAFPILLATTILTTVALIVTMLRHVGAAARQEGPKLSQDRESRVTVGDVITLGSKIPIASDRIHPEGAIGIILERLTIAMRQKRASRIVRRAFRRGTSHIDLPDPERYAVTALIRTDGVLEIWLMSRSWKTITITSRHRRVHMVHDDQGHLAAAVPARELAETVAIMATANE